MSLIDELGKVEDNAVQKMTIEIVCHKNISIPQVQSVVEGIKNKLGADDVKCKITQMEDIVHVFCRQENLFSIQANTRISDLLSYRGRCWRID